MALDGTDIAILSARTGVARLGASRLGFYPRYVEGTGTSEPGEYKWKEQALPETQWELSAGCPARICGKRPVASFTMSGDYGLAPYTVVFTDTSTPTGEINSWSWNFGDGSTSTVQHPTHIFSSVGTYTVSLTVASDRGTDTATDTVTVIDFQISWVVVPGACVAGNYTSITIQFDSTVSGGTPPYTYYWQFGDFGTHTSADPSHRYSRPGGLGGPPWVSYSVSLRVTDSTGAYLVSQRTITVFYVVVCP